MRVLGAHDAALEPMDPGSPDGELSRYFFVIGPNIDARRLRAALAKLPEIESAYIQPEPGLPGR